MMFFSFGNSGKELVIMILLLFFRVVLVGLINFVSLFVLFWDFDILFSWLLIFLRNWIVFFNVFVVLNKCVVLFLWLLWCCIDSLLSFLVNLKIEVRLFLCWCWCLWWWWWVGGIFGFIIILIMFGIFLIVDVRFDDFLLDFILCIVFVRKFCLLLFFFGLVFFNWMSNIEFDYGLELLWYYGFEYNLFFIGIW